jgi:hypothetical protein
LHGKKRMWEAVRVGGAVEVERCRAFTSRACADCRKWLSNTEKGRTWIRILTES